MGGGGLFKRGTNYGIYAIQKVPSIRFGLVFINHACFFGENEPFVIFMHFSI